MSMQLDSHERSSLAAAVIRYLEQTAPGSSAVLRGSLADGTADAYSDIDIRWEVPDEVFLSAVRRLPEGLAQVRPLVSLRSDPEFQNSQRRRLIFVQFHGVPLFWRVDIEVFAQSIHLSCNCDVDNQEARGDDWSLTHSALMNAIAAIRALLRGNDTESLRLVTRGFAKIGRDAPEGRIQHQILRLTQAVAELDPGVAELARQVQTLHREALGGAE